MHRWLVIGSFLLSACGNAPEKTHTEPGSEAPAPTLRIETDRGPVLGFADETLRVYLGIPYAAPPTGERRF